MNAVVETQVPQFDVDPFSDENIDEPYAMHEVLREAAPVTYLPKYDLFVLARHAECQAVLSNWEVFISSAGVGLANFRHEAPFRPRASCWKPIRPITPSCARSSPGSCPPRICSVCAICSKPKP